MSGLGLLQRRCLVPKSEVKEYVADSLLMWLDGLTKGSRESVTWQDLISPDGDYENYGAIVETDGYYCGDNGYLKNTIQSWLFKETRTMEILITVERVVSDISIPFIERDACFSLAVAPSLGAIIVMANNGSNNETTTYANPISTPGTYAFTLTNGELLCNGEALARVSKGSILSITNEGSFIGRRSDGQRKFYGIVHSIRIHDRSLSREEIMNNLEVDRARYSSRTF